MRIIYGHVFVDTVEKRKNGKNMNRANAIKIGQSIALFRGA
jgi:hypothetical protein